MPPTPESEAIDAHRVAVLAKLDEIVALLTTYVADVAASHAAAAAAATAEAAAALLDTAAHTDRTALATEAMAHKPIGTTNARYRQESKTGA